MPSSEVWWEAFYDEDYRVHFLEEVPAAALDFLVEVLELEPPSRLFDQCCGSGRMSLALARRGFSAVGVDQASGYIEQATRQGQPLAEFYVGDARHFVSPQLCDGGFNFHSSFGYFPRDSDNFAMLECAARSLRSGARFVLDFTNTLGILENFQERLISPLEDGGHLQRLSQLDWERGMLEQRWDFFQASGEGLRSHSSRIRLYMASQLGELLRAAGFSPLRLMGNYDGSPYQPTSPRLIWLSQRNSGESTSAPG